MKTEEFTLWLKKTVAERGSRKRRLYKCERWQKPVLESENQGKVPSKLTIAGKICTVYEDDDSF